MSHIEGSNSLTCAQIKPHVHLCFRGGSAMSNELHTERLSEDKEGSQAVTLSCLVGSRNVD